MRKKLNIQKFDEKRVLIYTSDGLGVGAINVINKIAKKESFHDMYFATLDDNRVGVVCKPPTWVKIMRWNKQNMGIEYPEDLEINFLRMCAVVLKGEEETQQYVEQLTKEEQEGKKVLKEAVDIIDKENKESGIDEQRDKEDKTWDSSPV